MPDLIDQAQDNEALFLQAALEAARPRTTEPQLVRGGVPVCLDCGEPISPKRLDVIPDACRCSPCQEEADQV